MVKVEPAVEELAARAREWAVTNGDGIRHVFNALQRNLDWPNVDTLQRELDAGGQDFDLLTFATRIPRELGTFDWAKRQLALKVRAVQDVPEAYSYVHFAFLVVWIAVGIYRNKDLPTVISSRDLLSARRHAGITDDRSWTLCMRFLESEEFYIFQGGTGSLLDAEWTRPLDPPRIRRYLHVENVDDYLLATAQLHWDALPKVIPNKWPPHVLSDVGEENTMTARGEDQLHPTNPSRPVTINVHGGTVGQLNVAEIVKNVDSRITAISGLPHDAIEMLRQFTQALETNTDLDDDTRQELLEHWEQVVEEVEKPSSERRLRRLKTVLDWVRVGVSASNSLLDLYQKLEPSLAHHLGLPGH